VTYAIACGDVMPGCAARFEGDTEDEVLQQVGRHAAEDHGITEITPEVLEAVRAAIKPAA
jgi:predicted small metal-binding protein